MFKVGDKVKRVYVDASSYGVSRGEVYIISHITADGPKTGWFELEGKPYKWDPRNFELVKDEKPKEYVVFSTHDDYFGIFDDLDKAKDAASSHTNASLYELGKEFKSKTTITWE